MKRIRSFYFLLIFCLLAPAYQVLARSSRSADCHRKLRILIIDGYSTGQHLAPFHSGQGIDVYHMHSAIKPPKEFEGSYHEEHYVDSFAPKSYEEALEIAQKMGFDAIMEGTETGVTWAAKMRGDFGMSNKVNEAILLARRNKYFMAERLRAYNETLPEDQKIQVVQQTLTNNVDQVTKFIKDHDLFPGKVVLKPPMSAGADGVYICENMAQVEAAFRKIEESVNLFDLKNDGVLVQEYLEGPEFAVNTVSLDGVHKTTDIWGYVKDDETLPGRRLYRHDILMDSHGEIQDQLVAYAHKVLDALEIELGWGHIEIIMTKRGPVLVEIGNRMMGANQPLIVAKALGRGQLEVGSMAFLKPDEFHKLPERYRLTKHASVVTLNCYFDKARFDESIIPRIKAIKGVVSMSLTPTKTGQKVKKTDDLLSAMGHVEIVHEDPEVVKASIAEIEALTRDGSFFINRPKNPK